MPTADYGSMEVNSQHQLWSRWTFVIQASRKWPGKRECIDNFRTWIKLGFRSSVGRARVEVLARRRYKFVVEIEGPPAHDPEYRESVRRQFAEQFLAKGFGSDARLVQFEASVLAGSKDDGTPPEQMIVLPSLDIPSLLH